MGGQPQLSSTPGTSLGPQVHSARHYQAGGVLGCRVVRSTSWTPRPGQRVCRQSSAGSLVRTLSEQRTDVQQTYCLKPPQRQSTSNAGSETRTPSSTKYRIGGVNPPASPSPPSRTGGITPPAQAPPPLVLAINSVRSASANATNSTLASPVTVPVPQCAMGSLSPSCPSQ